jgi:hypothetical protein
MMRFSFSCRDFNFGLEVDLVIEDGGQRGLSSPGVSAI